MTATLTRAEYGIVQDALFELAGNAPTEKREEAIWRVRHKLDGERTRKTGHAYDPATVRQVIETVRATKRVQQLTDKMLDEIAAALVEGRKVPSGDPGLLTQPIGLFSGPGTPSSALALHLTQYTG